MHRWLLAVTALTLGIGVMVCRASESAALQQKVETHTQAWTANSVEASVYFPTVIPGQPGTGPDADANGFDAQVKSWVSAISAQDEFRDWQNAGWTRYPLGAGMHGWLVLLHKNGKEIGYLIVGAAADGKLTLTEYGSGDHPLFSMQTLYRSLVQHELIRPVSDTTAYHPPLPVERLYYSPLHAVWKVANGGETIYIDAKTGEMLPLSAQSFESLQPFESDAATDTSPPQLARSLLLPSFDPFDNTYWIADAPLPVASSPDLLAALEAGGSPMTFEANLYGRKVLAPFAVTGFHVWESASPFIRLEQEGTRYVPFDALAEYGAFHQQQQGSST